MKQFIFSAFCAIGFAAGASAQAKLVEKVTAKPGQIVIPYEKYVLPNGLTVILSPDKSDPLVHVDVTYHVGSAREEIGKSGFAHFFEHMMFQGSDNVGDEQHFKIIEGAGGDMNGSTNLDRTNYYQTVPKNQLEKVLWLEADRMGFLLDAVTQEKFEIQRSTVKNERGQNYDNRPYGLAGEMTSKNLYPYGHPYSWLTIGYIEDLNRGNVNDLKNFFLRWYGPNNAAITIGGDFDTQQTLSLINKYFGGIKRGPNVTKTVLAPVVLTSDRYVSYTDNYARLPQLRKTFPTVPDYHQDMAALDCLAEILGQGKTSIMYQQMVKTQKALQASASHRNIELAGEFTFSAVPFAGQTLGSLDTLIRQCLAEFERRGVLDEDMEKFKARYRANAINGLQSVSGKVSTLANYQTLAGNPNKIGEELAMYAKVTKEDVMNAYNKYLRGKSSVTLSVLTKGGKYMAAANDNYTIDQSGYKAPDYGYNGLTYVKATDNFNRKMMPGTGPSPVIKVPVFKKSEQPNGLKMIWSPANELPLVNIAIRIPGGRLAESKDMSKAGLSALTASMLNEDSKNYTAEQMSVELAKLGSSVSVSSGLDGMTYSVQSLTQNLDKTLALLQEKMFNPVFKQETFDRIKKQSMESFRQSKAQPAAVASRVWTKLNHDGTILGMPGGGTDKTLENITLSDVESFYKNTLTTQNTQVVVTGDITEQEAKNKLSFLNNLPNKMIDLPKPAMATMPAKTVVYLVDIPKAAQTEFRVGGATNKTYDALGEYYRMGLMNYSLGGHFNSRLNLNLRETHGWTYGAGSGYSGNKYQGDFGMSAGIRANATDSALADVIRDIRNYAATGVTDEELTFLKSAIGNQDALSYETGFQKAGFIGTILNYDLPADYTDQQNAILKNLTKAELNALAKQWLNADKLNILLVGDKDLIMPGLQKAGYEIVELDVDGNRK